MIKKISSILKNLKPTKDYYCNHTYDDITDTDDKYLVLYVLDGKKTYMCKWCKNIKRDL